eukprot:TRINITY_DN3015_c0_g1_i2.p1 TRINITY_DN3015_c0_g1~~TRINITY_DN3015_c0_g1_i2.p1  ORF type:complete len:641 (+),score=82.28 TRINITY_DN3015_c0_g1_i2:385-2307(+)
MEVMKGELFSPARVKAIGKTLHSDLNMWPFELRGEHNEIVPEVVAEVIQEMGFVALERNVQSILDEVTECQRLSKGKQQGLLGSGKIGEIIRLVNLITTELRDFGSNPAQLEILSSLGVLHETFSKELDVEQKAVDDDPYQADVIRSQHQHPEFGFCCESIIDELLLIKKTKKNPNNITPLRVANTHLLKKHGRYKWTRKNVISGIGTLYIDRLLKDKEASKMWNTVFEGKTSIPLSVFTDKFFDYIGEPDCPLRPMLSDLLDECGDGVATLWSFHRVLSLFGIFTSLIDNLYRESMKKYFHPNLEYHEAALLVKNKPNSFVIMQDVKWCCIICVWSEDIGKSKPKIVVRETLISRESGAWVVPKLFPAETLRELVTSNSHVWKHPVGKDYNLTSININVENDDSQGSVPLHRACYTNNTGLVKILLKRGGRLTASLKTWAESGPFAGSQTPLMLSVTNGIGDPHPICTYLLQCGADPNARDALGQTILYKAILYTRHHLIQLFHDNGVECTPCMGAEPLLLTLGPSHHLGGYRHNVIFSDHRPCLLTVKEILRCYYTEVDHIPMVALALQICSDKISGNCDPPKDQEFLFKMEKINLTELHAGRFRSALYPVKEVLKSHLAMLKLKKVFDGGGAYEDNL